MIPVHAWNIVDTQLFIRGRKERKDRQTERNKRKEGKEKRKGKERNIHLLRQSSVKVL